MRILSQAVALSLFLFTAACGKLIYLPRPPTTTPVPSGKTEKPVTLGESAKQNNKNIGKISSLEAKLEKLNNTMLDKRTAGYNTAEAEALLQKIKEGLKTAKDLNFEDKFSEVEAKFKELGQLFDQAKKLIDKAPKFGDQPIKKEKIERKYGLDDREWVKEIRGEPSPLNKHFRAPSTVRLSIFNATLALTRSRCWDPRMQNFILENPPNVESWYYPENQMIYVFMETNTTLDDFRLRNDLADAQRDELLVQLCDRQVYSGYKLIYAGPPITDINSIFEQLLTGRMRFSGMFGLEGMERIVKATAALPDLTIASMAFDTSFQELNKLQAEQFGKFYELIRSIDPEVVKISDSIKEIRDSGATDAEKETAVKAFLKNQPDVTKKKLEAIAKISRWQRTLNASERDIGGVMKLFPGREKEIEEACSSFRETIMKLQAAFGSLRRALLKFKTQFPELLFKETDKISVFIACEGVRFNDKTLADGSQIEVPDISVKVLVKMLKGKYEEPVFVGESKEIKINNVNNYIDEVKEYRRLASFGIAFPFNLPPGRYEVTFTITDNLRVKTVAKDVSWTVVAVIKP